MPISGMIVGRKRVSTWMEYGVAAAIIGVIAAVLLGTVLYYEELAEKMQVELTILNMRAGLRYQVADRIIKARTGELAALGGSNPVRWLERPPAGYAGESGCASAEFMERGEWCFDPRAKELRYRPRLRSNLSPDLPVLRWRIVPVFATTGNRSVDSLALVNVEPYRWFQ